MSEKADLPAVGVPGKDEIDRMVPEYGGHQRPVFRMMAQQDPEGLPGYTVRKSGDFLSLLRRVKSDLSVSNLQRRIMVYSGYDPWRRDPAYLL